MDQKSKPALPANVHNFWHIYVIENLQPEESPPNMVCVTILPCKILTTTFFTLNFYRAMHFSAKRGIAIVYCPSVRPCVTFRYRDHIGWNSSKIFSRPNSLRPLLGLTQHGQSGAMGTPPKLGRNRVGVRSTKKPAISPKQCKVAMTD